MAAIVHLRDMAPIEVQEAKSLHVEDGVYMLLDDDGDVSAAFTVPAVIGVTFSEPPSSSTGTSVRA